MTNERQAKMLEKVRALLAKADGTNFPEEADTFRAKADELMTAYAIETWMVEAGQEQSRPVPERRDFDCDWYYRRFGSDLWQLLHACSHHCRVKMVWWQGASKVPMVGLPADLDYLDLLFTQLMVELVKRVEPKPDPRESVEANVYRLRAAGSRWPRTTQLMYDAGLIDLSQKQLERMMADGRPEWREIPYNIREQLKNRLANISRAYRRREGLEDYTSVHPEVFARSFSQGFVAQIRRRLRELRREPGREDSDGNSMALALRDIRVVVDEAAAEMFGEPPKSKSKAVGRELAFNMGAYQTGSREADRVNLSNNPSARISGRKELPR